MSMDLRSCEREHFRALRERLDYEHLVGKLAVVQEVEDAGCESGKMVREAFELSAERIGEAIAVQLQVDSPAKFEQEFARHTVQ